VSGRGGNWREGMGKEREGRWTGRILEEGV